MLTFVSVSRRARLLLSALLFAAGAAAASTALLTYFTRYSRFDSLIGEIDTALYAQITEMAPAEEVALVTGALLIAAALVVLLSMQFARGRSTNVGSGRYRYTVALRDTPIGIASRFHVSLDDMYAGLPTGVDNGAMLPGTVIAVVLDHEQVRSNGTVRCPQ